jgi:hypothetical protein
MSVFDYTSRDYASIQADLLTRAATVLPEWTTRDPSDFGMLMVDLWAYMGDVLHYYVDRAAGESNLQTATQRESVLAVASLLDYIPSSRSSASGQVVLDASNSDATDANPIIIPKYWRFVASPKVSSATDVVFTLNNALAITETNNTFYTDPITGVVYTAFSKATPITVTLTEGERFEETTTSNGKTNQQIQLTNTGVVTSSIEVVVTEGSGGSEVVYPYYPRLIEATSSQPAFSVDFTASDRTIITFGNDINGKVPLVNTDIKVSYRRSRGRAGNLPPNSIVGFESTILPDTRSLSAITVTSNTVNTVGGSDSESIDSMKANIPLAFRIQDRAVSLVDYRDLTLRVPGVSKAVATLSGSAVVINALSPQGDYDLRTSAQNSISVETTLSADIVSYLSTRSVVGVTYSVAAATTIQPVRITARINILDGYIQEKVKAEVQTAIATLFEFNNCSYGMQISLGTLYRTILAVKGVDYATVTQFTKTSGATTIDSTTVSSVKTFEGVSATSTGLLYLATDLVPSLVVVGGITGSAS